MTVKKDYTRQINKCMIPYFYIYLTQLGVERAKKK